MMMLKPKSLEPLPPEQRLDNQLCFAVHAAAHAFVQAYKPHLEPHGLTYPQYLVLLRLWERDGQTVNQLGEALYLNSGTLTPLLKRMERAGWLSRRRDAADERVVRIQLTKRGQTFREEARAIPNAMICASGIDAAELVSLRTKMKEVGAELRLMAAGSRR